MTTSRPTKPVPAEIYTRLQIFERLTEIAKKIELLEEAKAYWEAELAKTDTEVSS